MLLSEHSYKAVFKSFRGTYNSSFPWNDPLPPRKSTLKLACLYDRFYRILVKNSYFSQDFSSPTTIEVNPTLVMKLILCPIQSYDTRMTKPIFSAFHRTLTNFEAGNIFRGMALHRNRVSLLKSLPKLWILISRQW